MSSMGNALRNRKRQPGNSSTSRYTEKAVPLMLDKVFENSNFKVERNTKFLLYAPSYRFSLEPDTIIRNINNDRFMIVEVKFQEKRMGNAYERGYKYFTNRFRNFCKVMSG